MKIEHCLRKNNNSFLVRKKHYFISYYLLMNILNINLGKIAPKGVLTQLSKFSK